MQNLLLIIMGKVMNSCLKGPQMSNKSMNTCKNASEASRKKLSEDSQKKTEMDQLQILISEEDFEKENLAHASISEDVKQMKEKAYPTGYAMGEPAIHPENSGEHQDARKVNEAESDQRGTLSDTQHAELSGKTINAHEARSQDDYEKAIEKDTPSANYIHHLYKDDGKESPADE